MSGTAKTTSALLAEQPDNAVQSIRAQQLRNVTVSGPQWDVVGSTPAPGILRGTIDLVDYMNRNGGFLGSGQSQANRTTNATVVQAACDYAATNGMFMDFPPDIIEIYNSAGIVWSNSPTNYSGFVFRGTRESTINQFFQDAPTLTIGNITTTNFIDSLSVDGLNLGYSGGTSTVNTILNFGSVFVSNFRNIHAAGTFNNNVCIQVGNASGTTNCFSCSFEGLSGSSANGGFLWINGPATGAVWRNIYFSNNNGTSTPSSAITAPFVFANSFTISESVFDQMNIEHVATNNSIFINGGNATFISCHFENHLFTGTNPVMWLLGQWPNCNVQVIGGQTLNPTFNSTQCSGTCTLVRAFDDGNFLSYGHHIATNTSGPGFSTNTAFSVFDANSSGLTPHPFNRGVKRLDGFQTNYSGDNDEAFLSIESRLPVGTYGSVTQISGFEVGPVWSRAKRVILADPVTNLVVYGAMGAEAIVQYNNPLVANRTIVLGHNLTASGSAGQNTLRPVGDQVLIIRESTATGAFTITVKDGTTGGTTIGTFTTTSAGTAQTFGFSGTAWTASP